MGKRRNSAEARAQARALVLRMGWNSAAYQILNPGMELWFSDAGDAVAGFSSFGAYWVVAGAPVCARDRLGAVAQELQSDAAGHGKRVLYFGAGERLERLLGARNEHHLLRLGAQPAWDPARWCDVVKDKASLRAQLNRATNKGVQAFALAPSEVPARIPELRAILNAWLGDRGLPPLHFMTEPDTLGDLRDRRLFVAEWRGTPVAFLVATPIPARNGWLVEQWPRRHGAPNGTTHLLVDAAMRSFGESGSNFATLGLAPLSERAGAIGRGEPSWLRFLLQWIRVHGRRFYNFRGLDAFKASLQPASWEPIYAITPGARVTPQMMTAVAGVFGGGSPFGLVVRAGAMAVRREFSSIGKSHG